MAYFEIRNIDVPSLIALEQLLSLSVGYPTSMADEIGYFEEESPKGWFFASDMHGKKLGFIRSFKQGDDWSCGELFVEAGNQDRKLIAEGLLKTFLANNSFPTKHRLRFDLSSEDYELNEIFNNLELNIQSQTFNHFGLTISPGFHSNVVEAAIRDARPEDVADAMSNLHAVSVGEVQGWIEDGSLRIEMFDSQVAAVAQIAMYPESAEIIRLATHKKFLRQGHARNLMMKITKELAATNIPTLFLKVEDVRLPAIEFYKDFGFEDIPEKKQTWYSIYFDGELVN